MSWPVEVVEAPRGKTPESGVDRATIAWDCFWYQDREPQYFLWGCPLCGGLWSGWLAGPKPMPQGHVAVWTNSGTRERPTLSPSLVCAGVRLGAEHPELACTGHFLMRDGQLVVA